MKKDKQETETTNTISYQEYRKQMELIVFNKRKLIESMALKKKAWADYKKYLEEEKVIREKLFSMIPEHF